MEDYVEKNGCDMSLERNNASEMEGTAYAANVKPKEVKTNKNQAGPRMDELTSSLCVLLTTQVKW